MSISSNNKILDSLNRAIRILETLKDKINKFTFLSHHNNINDELSDHEDRIRKLENPLI